MCALRDLRETPEIIHVAFSGTVIDGPTRKIICRAPALSSAEAMSARKRPAETDVAGELAQIGAKLDQLKDIGLDEKLHEKWIRAVTGRLPRLATFDHASLRSCEVEPAKGVRGRPIRRTQYQTAKPVPGPVHWKQEK